MADESTEIHAEKELENGSGDTGSKNKSSAGSDKSGRKRKSRELFIPAVDRPARERKSIERLVISPDKEIKEFKIAKGIGTALKNIPNIVFKLSKRKGADEVVQSLHKILYAKTSKAHFAKTNILQFSGYVWGVNEEKEKAKAKERLEKCVRETIVQISDVLDLNLARSMKKEDIILNVFEFLESPYKTTDKLVEELDKAKKGKKSKRTPVKGARKKTSGQTPSKSPKNNEKTPRKEQTHDEEEEGDSPAHEEDVEEEPKEESDDDYGKKPGSTKKRKRGSMKKQSKKEIEVGKPSAKKRKPNKEAKKEKKPAQEAKKEKKMRSKTEKVEELTDEDLRGAICDLLQDADYGQMTFADVIKQLGEKFKVDLTSKKAHLKVMIKEEIAKIVNEDYEDEDNADGENGKDVVKDSDEHVDEMKEDDEDKVGEGEGEDGEGAAKEGEDIEEKEGDTENGGGEDDDGDAENGAGISEEQKNVNHAGSAENEGLRADVQEDHKDAKDMENDDIDEAEGDGKGNLA